MGQSFPSRGTPRHSRLPLSSAALAFFSWKEWTEAIGREIKDHPQQADEDANTAYHCQWLSTLEGILCRHGLINPSEVSDVMEHWRRSYVRTPHGLAVAANAQPTPTVRAGGVGHERCAQVAGPYPVRLVDRIPIAAWMMMGLIAVTLIVGYEARRRGALLFVLPIVVSIAFLLIADIDSPRGGIIRVLPQNLISLSQSTMAQ
jgi:hypothetical protein